MARQVQPAMSGLGALVTGQWWRLLVRQCWCVHVHGSHTAAAHTSVSASRHRFQGLSGAHMSSAEQHIHAAWCSVHVPCCAAAAHACRHNSQALGRKHQLQALTRSQAAEACPPGCKAELIPTRLALMPAWLAPARQPAALLPREHSLHGRSEVLMLMLAAPLLVAGQAWADHMARLCAALLTWDWWPSQDAAPVQLRAGGGVQLPAALLPQDCQTSGDKTFLMAAQLQA